MALTTLDVLEQAGATVLGPVGSIEEAVAFIATHAGSFDRVVLDLNLHGRRSYPVADALIDRGVPFVFTTGYDLSALDDSYRRYPHCVKPVMPAKLVSLLAG